MISAAHWTWNQLTFVDPVSVVHVLVLKANKELADLKFSPEERKRGTRVMSWSGVSGSRTFRCKSCRLSKNEES